jgi:hypothetical protein
MRTAGPRSPHEASTKPPLPIWSLPLLLAVLGIVLLVGNLSVLLGAVAAVETVLVCAYLLLRARRTEGGRRSVSNVLGLLPGHLLLLLAVSLLREPDRLAALWTAVPIVSLAYDFVSRKAPKGPARTRDASEVTVTEAMIDASQRG